MIASITLLSVVSLERAESERRESRVRERERYTQRSTVKERAESEREVHTAETEKDTHSNTHMHAAHAPTLMLQHTLAYTNTRSYVAT